MGSLRVWVIIALLNLALGIVHLLIGFDSINPPELGLHVYFPQSWSMLIGSVNIILAMFLGSHILIERTSSW